MRRFAPTPLFLPNRLVELDKPSISWSIPTARTPFRGRRRDQNAFFVGGRDERSWPSSGGRSLRFFRIDTIEAENSARI
jgi:hypothetical protein